MKRTIAMLAGLVLALLTVAGPASATGGDQPADNKKVTLCHATSSETNPYNKIEVSVSAFYNSGHIDHGDDIWEAFSYTTKKGDVVNVPAQGDTSLLAFEDCQKPKEDTPIAKPAPVYADPCGTEDDVFSVAPGTGYTVAGPVVSGSVQTITVTLADGFVWADGSHDALTFERPAFTDIDCDLPETGVGETLNTTAGYAALAGVLLIGGFLLLTSRRRTDA